MDRFEKWTICYFCFRKFCFSTQLYALIMLHTINVILLTNFQKVNIVTSGLFFGRLLLTVCIVVVVLCIVVILCVFVVLCVNCCFYFKCRTAGYRSVFGRSCDRPPRHRFFLVSLCLKSNAEMVPKIPSCHCMLLMQTSRLKFSSNQFHVFLHVK